jgi:hypothetical protein
VMNGKRNIETTTAKTRQMSSDVSACFVSCTIAGPRKKKRGILYL